MLGFLDAGVQFVAQAVVDRPLGRKLPGVLKIKVVGFASHRRLVKFIADRSCGRGSGDGIGIRGGGKESSEGIRKRLARKNVVQAACRSNFYRRVGGASAKGVNATRIGAKNGGVFVQAGFKAPLETVRAVNVVHRKRNLVDISVGTIDGTVGRIEAEIKTVPVDERRIRVIGRGENGSAADISEGGREIES